MYAYEVFANGGALPVASGGGVDQTLFSFTPADNGVYEVVLSVSDEDGGSGQVSQTVTIGNEAPTPSIDSVSSPRIEGTRIDVSANATDPAGPNDTLTYTYNVFKDGGATPIASASGTDLTAFNFTPTDGGSFEIILTVSDEDGGAMSDSEAIEVEAINAPPITNPQSYDVTEDGRVSIVLDGVDGETAAADLTFTILSVPANGTLFALTGEHVAEGDMFTGARRLTLFPAPVAKALGSPRSLIA